MAAYIGGDKYSRRISSELHLTTGHEGAIATSKIDSMNVQGDSVQVARKISGYQ